MARAGWAEIRERARGIDVFVAVSRHYASVMEERAGIPPGRVRVVPIGVDAASYPAARPDPAAPVIGFLSRMSEGSGLGVLVDAVAFGNFIQLRSSDTANPVWDSVSGIWRFLGVPIFTTNYATNFDLASRPAAFVFHRDALACRFLEPYVQGGGPQGGKTHSWL